MAENESPNPLFEHLQEFYPDTAPESVEAFWRPRKIDHRDPAYRWHREEVEYRNSSGLQDKKTFEPFLKRLQGEMRHAQEFPEDADYVIEAISAAAETLQADIIGYAQNPVIQKHLEENFLGSPGFFTEYTAEGFAEAIRNLSTEELVDHATNYQERFERKRDKLAEKLPDWHKEFAELAEKAVRNGAIPLDTEELLRRLDEVSVLFFDGIEAYRRNQGGFHQYETRRVGLSTEWTMPDTRKIYFHELLHAISGTNWLARGERVQANRSGVGFPSRFCYRFRWLNEPVTENITQELGGSWRTNASYPKERALFKAFKESGAKRIPDRLFREAYFEDYQLGQKSGAPAWKRLRKAINEAYEPRFLIELDEAYLSHGTEAAANLLEQWSATHGHQSHGRLRRAKQKVIDYYTYVDEPADSGKPKGSGA